jgi:hypothetical protein
MDCTHDEQPLSRRGLPRPSLYKRLHSISYSISLFDLLAPFVSVVLRTRTKFHHGFFRAFARAAMAPSCLGTVVTSGHNRIMKKGDVICPQCNAGFRRIELASRSGHAGEFRCPLCDEVLEVFDGSSEIVYRITVAPEKLFE